MSFVDYQFLLFFPVFTAVFFVLKPHRRWVWLLLMSCYFYMCFVPHYILILGATILVDYTAGLVIARLVGWRRRLALLVSLAANLGMLGFFKYWGFLAVNWDLVAARFGLPRLPVLDVILPIGLSFATFQSLAYTIDVYRGHQAVERHFGRFATYVMFYPQLVAGPIERPQNLLEQLHRVQVFDSARAADGLRLMLWGFFKKVVVADRLAEYVNAVYATPAQHTGPAVMLATYFFAFQIYCDFSGYTDIARGAGRVMGFDIMLNFRRPYFAQTIAEFWQRWHISLSTWFRDYLYIPLGGNRVAPWRWRYNILIVFLISGLWHGANWTFVVWGGLHGLYFLIGAWTAPLRARLRARLDWPAAAPLLRWGRTLFIFHLTWFAWVFFRAPSLAAAGLVLRRMADWHAPSVLLPGMTAGGFAITLTALAILIAIETLWERRPVNGLIQRLPGWIRFPLYAAAVLAIMNLGVTQEIPFIYFQF